MIDNFVSSCTLLRGLELLAQYESLEIRTAALEAVLPAAFPINGVGNERALEMLAPNVLGGSRRLGDVGFFAHMDPPVPSVAAAAALWNASLNQNLLHVDTAPVAREIDERIVGWLTPFFGMTAGHMVPGSTAANIEALWVARELKDVREIVASQASHVSIEKAAQLLRLPLRLVEVDERQRMRPSGLGDLRRSALVLTAGTTAAGAIDPLDAGPEAAWRHVDAAWAGPLRLSPLYAHLLAGIERADSVAVSAHKWLFQPKDAALALFARRDALEAISFGGSYLKSPTIGLMGSSGARAIPLAATLLAFGQQGIASLIERCMSIANELANLVASSPDFELFDNPQSGCILWRPRYGSAAAVAARMQGALVSTTVINGESWLRSIAANPFASPNAVFNAARISASLR